MSRRRRKSNAILVGTDGPACPRCHHRTAIFEHSIVDQRLLKQACYYKRWYLCRNPDCQTTLIMPNEHRVWSKTRLGAPQPEPHFVETHIDGVPPWGD